VNLTDATGRDVMVPKDTQRIITLAPDVTEIVYALDAGKRVVGTVEASDYPPEVIDVDKIGGLPLNFERIVSLEADLVLGSNVTSTEEVNKLEELGQTVVMVYPSTGTSSLDQVYAGIRLVGQVIGASGKADALVVAMQQRVETLLAELPARDTPVRVFFELDSGLYTVGPGALQSDLITLAGGASIAEDTGQAYPQLSAEAIIKADPEVILLADVKYGVTIESVAERPGWGDITAVRRGAVYAVDPDLSTRAGPRIVDGLAAIIEALHTQ
jgi:iron complex transport system substrate-binding protein